jgi:hypothetical protein
MALTFTNRAEDQGVASKNETIFNFSGTHCDNAVVAYD